MLCYATCKRCSGCGVVWWVWCGVVGVVWGVWCGGCGVVWCGMVWCGVVWYGVVGVVGVAASLTFLLWFH